MTQVNTNTIRQLQPDVNGFRSLTRIHEHDFVGEKASIICSTCGLRYCEKCGKGCSLCGGENNHFPTFSFFLRESGTNTVTIVG
jgi:hypothetical protein